MAQQERATATRQGILLAAAHVFEAKGFDAATVADIVEHAQCTKGALYFHFASKEALAEAIAAEQGVWVAAHTRPSERPMQQIVDGSFAFAQALREDVVLRASIRLTVQTAGFDGRTAQGYQMFADAIQGYLKAAHARGLLLHGRGLRAVAECITACVTGTQMVSEALSGHEDLPRRLRLFWRLILPSIVTPEHLAELRLTPPRRRPERVSS
jgi:AcrR family transcriptional regulator